MICISCPLFDFSQNDITCRYTGEVIVKMGDNRPNENFTPGCQSWAANIFRPLTWPPFGYDAGQIDIG